MIKRTRQQEHMISQRSSTGAPLPPPTSQYARDKHLFGKYKYYLRIIHLYHVIIMQTYCQVSNYEKELEEMKSMTRQEFVASLRRFYNLLIFFPFFNME